MHRRRQRHHNTAARGVCGERVGGVLNIFCGGWVLSGRASGSCRASVCDGVCLHDGLAPALE
eukprot:11254274-Prorocentrum_lima.AAC.1